MAIRGRKPKPTAVKEVTGNPGKRPLNENEPKFAHGPIPKPPDLTPEAEAEWMWIVPQLLSARLVSPADHATIEAYCRSFGHWRAAEKILTQTSVVITGSNNVLKENPYSRVARYERDRCIKFAAELGITPSSRSRIEALKDDKTNPAERLFK